MFVYQVTTSHSLPHTKKLFSCRCEAVNYLEEFLKKHGATFGESELSQSVRLTAVDNQKIKNYKNVFLEKEFVA